MTQEEKAKAYDEALERAKKEWSNNLDNAYKNYRERLEIIFPELAESEDERISREITEFILTHRIDEPNDIEDTNSWLVWLEKQGEQRLAIEMKTPEESLGIDSETYNKIVDECIFGKQEHVDEIEPKFKVGDTMRTLQEANDGYTDGMPVVVSIDDEYYHCTNELIAIKDQDDYEFPPINMKQKPINKVETKFNAGDWITNEESVWQIDEVKTENYLLIDSEGILFAEEIAMIDSEFHLWTIKDAKDGNVLTVDDERPFIFKGCLDPSHPDSPVAYCGIDTEGYFCVGGSKFNHWWTDEKVHPATKEQRDLLFSKIEEVGYIWDNDEKGLRKIDQNLVDKIETKFNIGDWVVNKLGDVWHIDSIDNKNYQVSDGKGNYNYFPISKQDEMHLWTIAGAKDGDVLSMNWHDDDDFWEKIIIFKKYHNKGVEGLFNTPCVEGYGNTFKNGKLALCEEVPYYSKTWTTNLQPATKEQRDTLMKAMADAGYEWDNNKKELKKISQRMISAEAKEALYDKINWSEEDNYGFDCVAQCITQALLSSNTKQDSDICKCARNWINSIKQRLTNA